MSKQLLYVGGYAAVGQPGIGAFWFDGAAGGLVPAGSHSGIRNPSYLLLHPNGRWLYAVSETGAASGDEPGSVWALMVSEIGGEVSFTALNRQSTAGDWPCHLALDQSGRWLFASNYGSGSVAVFPIKEDGSLGERHALLQHEGSGPNETRQEGPHAHSAIVSADNRFVIVADLGIDSLMIYRFEAKSGALSLHEQVRTAPGAGPRHMAWAAGGARLYVAYELDSTVGLCRYDGAAGKLTPVGRWSTVPAGVDYNDVADIHLSADEQWLYVSNRGHNSLAVFAIGSDGALTPAGHVACGGDWPRNFALAPGGSHILVANQRSDALAVLPLAAGQPGGSLGDTAMPGPSCVQFA